MRPIGYVRAPGLLSYRISGMWTGARASRIRWCGRAAPYVLGRGDVAECANRRANRMKWCVRDAPYGATGLRCCRTRR